MKVIYIDTLFIINTAANLLLLAATSKICDAHCRRLKLILSSAFGGVYAVFAALPDFIFLNTLLTKALIALAMILITFGFSKIFLRLYAVFIALSAAAGGLIYAVNLKSSGFFSSPTARSATAVFLFSAALWSVIFRNAGKPTGKTHKIQVEFSGKTARFTAFTDTGNHLKDPISGKPVIIIGIDEIKPLLPLSLYKLIAELSPTDFLQAISGTEHAGKFRLLPYSAVGVKSGMLIAMRADLKIDGKPAENLIAISPTCISDGGAYSALMGV